MRKSEFYARARADLPGPLDGVRVVDISDPTSPQEAAVIFSGAFTTDVFVQGDHVYICNDDGLDIFDISTPTSPLALGTLAIDGAHSVAVDGDFAYVTDYDALHVINVSNPNSPTSTGLYAPAGFFSSDDKLAGQFSDAGEKVGEKVWRMPLGEAYDKMLKSDIADIKNISGGRGALVPATFRL